MGNNQAGQFTKKRRSYIETGVEWTIRIIASASIFVIFLILFFVFKEAMTLFSAGHVGSSDGNQKADSLHPYVYNPEIMTAEEEALINKPEVYNPDIEEYGYTTGHHGSAISEGESSGVFSTTWQPIGEHPKFGIMPLLVGTAKTTIIAILLGAPLGILAAIYSAFFAGRRFRQVVKPAIELLAGFPSVVIGFFCLAVVATYVQDLFGTEYRLNAFVGGIGLSLAVIPIVFTIAEDSLTGVPRSLYEASLAMGSTTWQTAFYIMLPAAAPGVFAAVLLGIGRAFGETMIAIMATGNAALISISLFDPVRTVAATIGAEMGEVVWGSEHYGILFLLGVILFLVSFSLNAVTELYVKQRLLRRFHGR